MDTLTLTNTVPMLSGFKANIWTGVWEYIYNLSQQHESFNIVVGPSYDYNYDGRRDDDDDIKRYLYIQIYICKTVKLLYRDQSYTRKEPCEHFVSTCIRSPCVWDLLSVQKFGYDHALNTSLEIMNLITNSMQSFVHNYQ